MTRLRRTSMAVIALSVVVAMAVPTHAEEPFRYVAGKHGKGELKYVNGLPVLFVEGTPEEIGDQAGTLLAGPVKRMLEYPREYVKKFGFEAAFPTLVKVGKSMAPQFPPDHLKELEAAARAARVDRDLAVAGNTFADIRKFGGCSTLVVESERSATRGPLFGRNLDYPTLGFLHEYSLVTVCRPTGKHAFASIGFPGLVGCLSGMNDDGLAVAILEVYASKDESPSFDPKGTPYSLCYRRVLEECKTIGEAEKLLRTMHRTTRNNLAVCDRTGAAVLEITPTTIRVRRSQDGLCPCTNHFRTPDLATTTTCPRYAALEQARPLAKVDVAALMKLMDGANQGEKTFQTMIFEPRALKLHLSIGQLPSSAHPPKLLELEGYFKKK